MSQRQKTLTLGNHRVAY